MPRVSTAIAVANAGKVDKQVVALAHSLLTVEQANWLSFRRGVESDEKATIEYNKWIANPDRFISDTQVEQWWKSDEFGEMAVAVLQTPPTQYFLAMADTLLPAAYRALFRMLNSTDGKNAAKAIELLLRAKGLLIDKVEHTDSTKVNDALGRLAKLEDVVTQQVYHSPLRLTEGATEGEYRQVED